MRIGQLQKAIARRLLTRELGHVLHLLWFFYELGRLCWRTTLLILLCGSLSLAGETPSDAVRTAALAQSQLHPALQPHSRYLWVHDARPDALDGITVALNMISRSELSVIPERVRLQVPNTDEWIDTNLVRVDLLEMAPGGGLDYVKMFALWESLVVNEPHFYALGAGTLEIEEVTICGQAFSELTVRSFGEHVTRYASEAAAGLAESTHSLAPILRADHFVSMVTTTLDGGRYYDFIDVVPGKTTLTEYLAAHGASIEDVKRLRSDERSAIAHSLVTGKVRAFSVFRGRGVRPSVGTGVITITDDIFDEDVDPTLDPFRTLVDFKPRGHEVIIERRNGWPECTLWNEQQVAVDVAPPNIASDHRIPASFTKQLQPCLSCVRCHAEDSMYKPFGNDVKRMFGDDGFDILGDLTQDDGARRIAGLYSGDLSHTLLIARDTLADLVVRATQKDSVPAVLTSMALLHDSYQYELVGAERACLEIGLDPGLDAQQTLLHGLGPSALRRDGLILEDPTIRMIQRGIEVDRKRFNLVFTDMCLRAMPTILEQRAKLEVQP